MKKNIFKVSLALFSIATMCVSVSSYFTASKQSDLLLCENVLALSEDVPDKKMTLTSTGCTTYATINGKAQRVHGKVTQCVETQFGTVCTPGCCYYGSASTTN